MKDLDIKIDDALTRLSQSGFESLSETDKVLVTLHELEAEVNNGGFDQYYFNSSGNHALYAQQALIKIGAKKMAEIVLKANKIFGEDGPPKDWDERQNKLEKIVENNEEAWEALDAEFYEYPDDINNLLQKYIENETN